MEIGSKLRQSRNKAGLTQEVIAEKIGVSRQTISNWENNKSYPDIISVIALSDLYSISLDELLKEDKAMILHLEESTNNVRSRQKFSKLIQISTYCLIWAVAIIVFWLGGREDAMGYSIVAFYLVLPITTFIISILIGKDEGWSAYKWLMVLFFGLMYMLALYATFSLANIVAFGNFYLPELTPVLLGALISALGLLIGTLVKDVRQKRSVKKNKASEAR